MSAALSKLHILKNIRADEQSLLDELRVYESITSTNDELLALANTFKGNYVACCANHQTSGRGRNGHVWRSPANVNIYLSLAGIFDLEKINTLGGLSLACAVTVSKILANHGVDTWVKWPNDIMLNDKKLAGLLIESKVKRDGVFVVIGIGLNVSMSQIQSRLGSEEGDVSAESLAGVLKISQPWVDLKTALIDGAAPDRSLLSGQLLEALIACCSLYKRTGFEAFSADWSKYDGLYGRIVQVKTNTEIFAAKVLGLNHDYGLKVVQSGGEETVVYAADISIKLSENVKY